MSILQVDLIGNSVQIDQVQKTNKKGLHLKLDRLEIAGCDVQLPIELSQVHQAQTDQACMSKH